MSLPTLTFRAVTYCTDPRCVSVQRCQRAEHERYGNAPGENYGPRCIPVPALDLASGAASVYALGVEEGERQATARIVAHMRREADDAEPKAAAALLDVSDAIERGEHLRSSKEEK